MQKKEDCRFRISKKYINRINNLWKEEIGGKEREEEKKKRGQEISVDREEGSVNKEEERNFG